MTLAEEPALLRVVFGDALVGEVAGELSLSWDNILSLTVAVARFWRLSVTFSFGLAARRGSLDDVEATESWGVGLWVGEYDGKDEVRETGRDWAPIMAVLARGVTWEVDKESATVTAGLLLGTRVGG